MDLKNLLTQETASSTLQYSNYAGIVPFRGINLELKIVRAFAGIVRIKLLNNTLSIYLPILTAKNLDELIKKRLLLWLKSQARTTICREIEILRNKYLFEYESVCIKDTKSRWGSCSSKKNLNFSWRLIMAPPEVLKYVVIHETAHLSYLNHSKNFWETVQERCPEYKQHKNWLKARGGELMHWVPTVIEL